MMFRSRSLVGLALVVAGCGTTATPVPSAPPGGDATPRPTASASTSSTPPTSDPATSSGLGAADLDGVMTTAELAHRLPLAFSIDDARAGRPQSGFNAASIVWQAPADGYETRYLFVLQELDASDIGPVRSARFYLAHWAAEDAAAVGHYGGDRMTRAWMEANRGDLFTDVDGLGAGNPAYHRISSRQAPYNAYTSSAAFIGQALRLGADETIDLAVHLRPFRDDSPLGDRGASQAIRVPYNTIDVGYAYDPIANAYRRTLNGKPQVDPMDGQPVWARTVIVLFMPFHTDSTIEPGHNRPVLGFVGSGKAVVFMEGRLVTGTWSKPHENDPTMVRGPDGSELPLIRGRIFIQVVPLGTEVAVDS
jgi:hypothetical protein